MILFPPTGTGPIITTETDITTAGAAKRAVTITVVAITTTATTTAANTTTVVGIVSQIVAVTLPEATIPIMIVIGMTATITNCMSN